MPTICNKSISFYSDAPEWGGQEILSARIATILAETNEVTFFFSCDKFAEVLPTNIRRVKLPFHSQTPFPIFRDRFKGKTQKAKELFLPKMQQRINSTQPKTTAKPFLILLSAFIFFSLLIYRSLLFRKEKCYGKSKKYSCKNYI